MSESARDPKKRFSDRVAPYVQYRPSYPPEILSFLDRVTGLLSGSVVADIGSGTGLLARLFLENGNRVFGVEPNPEMRQAGEIFLAGYPHFTSVPGSAEATTLSTDSVDLATAGQAFHWFDAASARVEFRRILRRDGWVALVWNTRAWTGDAFMAGYEALLRRYARDYRLVNHRQPEAEKTVPRFFHPGEFEQDEFDNRQVFAWEGLEGRLLSSSYAPLPGQPGHREMLIELRRLFNRYQKAGRVHFLYRTQVYVGSLE